MAKLGTLITDPFEDDAISILEWAYGPQAKWYMINRMACGQRTGQAFMNTLSMYDYESYKKLTGTLEDPFHDDALLPKAIDKLTSK